MATAATKIQKNFGSHRVSIERFAYDLFSYILPIFDFPETHALRTDIEENIYISKDFVEKAALSVLPFAMYNRDGWKQIFEYRQRLTGFSSLEMIQDYLKRVLIQNPDFRNADIATQVRESLALFNEIILFFKYKDLVTHVESLPKLWSEFYLENISKNQDIEKLFESSFLIFPEVSESAEWILTFVEKYAVPYGRLDNVSEIFSVYSIVSEDSKISPIKKCSKNDATQDEDISDEFVAEAPNVIDQKSVSFPRDSQAILPATPITMKVLDHQAITSSEGNSDLEIKACRKQPTPSADVCAMNSMPQRALEMEMDEAFGKINLDSENISQEHQ